MTSMRSALAVQPELPAGVQQARIRSVPSYVSSAGIEAIQAYELTGRRLDEWQKAELIDGCGERADGRWAAFEVAFVDPRQNGKDENLLAIELAGLFVWGERLIGHSAHLFDTAMEHLERLAELIESVPEFSRRCRSSRGSLVNRSHGHEGITLKSGARIRFRARTRTGSFRGFTGDRMIFNEAMDLPDALVGSIMPVLSARSTRIPGPQVVYAGSAVDQTTMANGTVFARLREAGISGSNERLAYFEHSADVRGWLAARGQRFESHRPEIEQITAEMLGDPHMWAQANPALGVRIAHEHVLTEFQSPSMAPRQFAVERLGVGDWPATSEDDLRVITRTAWTATVEFDVSKRIAGTCFFSLDCSPDDIWGSVSVAGRRDDGLFHTTLVAHERGKEWIVPRCEALCDEHPDARFVVDAGGPAAHLIPALRMAGVPLIEAGTRDYADACAGLLDAIDERRLRHPSVPDLDEAVASARKQKMGDRWKWSRRDSAAPDVSPVVACSLALWAAERRSGVAGVFSFSDLLGDDDPADLADPWGLSQDDDDIDDD